MFTNTKRQPPQIQSLRRLLAFVDVVRPAERPERGSGKGSQTVIHSAFSLRLYRVPERLITEELRYTALHSFPGALQFVPEQYLGDALLVLAYRHNAHGDVLQTGKNAINRRYAALHRG